MALPRAVMRWEISLEQWGWKLGQAGVRDGVSPAGVVRWEQGWEGGQTGEIKAQELRQVWSLQLSWGWEFVSWRPLGRQIIRSSELGLLLPGSQRSFVIDLDLSPLLIKGTQSVNVIHQSLCSYNYINFGLASLVLGWWRHIGRWGNTRR